MTATHTTQATTPEPKVPAQRATSRANKAAQRAADRAAREIAEQTSELDAKAAEVQADDAADQPEPTTEPTPEPEVDTSDPPDGFGTPGHDTREADAHAAEPEVPEVAQVTLTPAPALTDEQTEQATKPVTYTLTVPAGVAGALIDDIEQNWPMVTVVLKPAKGAKAAKGPKPLPFPAGVIAPIAFHKLITSEGIAPATLRAMTIYEWINRTAKNGFPVTYYASDGTDFHTKQDGTRPGVHVEQGRAWVTAKFAPQPTPETATSDGAAS